MANIDTKIDSMDLSMHQRAIERAEARNRHTVTLRRESAPASQLESFKDLLEIGALALPVAVGAVKLGAKAIDALAEGWAALRARREP